jgi:hypothetical protein
MLFLDAHASQTTHRVLTCAGSQRILIIQLVVHSSLISQPLDLCVFGIFEGLDKRENKMKGMKGEALKMYRGMAAFYKATRILMVRWSFIRAGFGFNPNNMFAFLPVNPEIILERIVIPEIPIEQLATPETLRPQIVTDGELRRRHRIPGPHALAVSLRAYGNKATNTCPFMVM